MKILADNSLPNLRALFPKPFILSFYDNSEELANQLEGQDVLLCRSTLKVNKDLLGHNKLLYIATASSGTDHLDHAFLNAAQIKVIDAKGANASSVADYVLASVAYLEQMKIMSGKQASIIGMGAVGNKVYQQLKKIGFQIKCYDPPKAKRDLFISCSLEDLYEADLLCVHANLHAHPPFPSLNMINHHFLSLLKPGCVIINASRGGIVEEQALLEQSSKIHYCTDVYSNEPFIEKKIVDKALLCTPHIAGHSLEAKWKAVELISKQLHKLLGLPLPQYDTVPFLPDLTFPRQDLSWRESVLNLYNPYEETLKLKQAENVELAFLNLRAQHTQRHDFACYKSFM